jgi:phosphatidylserine/phosphatidylglycerophosphate/cardiolipin synthase-like enzyme
VRIHLYGSAFLHAKHASIDDDVAMIGSSNLDIRSFALNSEVSLLVYDANVVSALHKIQDRYMAGERAHHARTMAAAQPGATLGTEHRTAHRYSDLAEHNNAWSRTRDLRSGSPA